MPMPDAMSLTGRAVGERETFGILFSLNPSSSDKVLKKLIYKKKNGR
jgi:hypothetical protein